MLNRARRSGRFATAHRRPGPSALGAYRHLGLRARLHTYVRWSSAPLAALEGLVPQAGEVLDIGCGHGLLSIHLALRSRSRTVVGVDIDGDKLHLAARAAEAAGVGERTHFCHVDAEWSPEPNAYDAVVIADVLYLLDREEIAGVLSTAARAVRRGGVIVVKELADRPRWKRTLVLVQEHAAVRVLRLTQGQRVSLPSEAELGERLATNGVDVARHDLSAASFYPHVAFVGRKRRTSSPHTPCP